MQHFFVYILQCSDNSYYIGHTDNLEHRLSEYTSGDSSRIGKYVAERLPIKLVFHDVTTSRVEAIEMERKLKGWTRKKKEALINGGWEAVKGIWKNKD